MTSATASRQHSNIVEKICSVLFLLRCSVKKHHENSEHPIKKPKNRELTPEEKQYNKELAQRRIYIEHVNRHLKIFRICKETYRNKGNRMELRVKLVAAIYNLMSPLKP